MTSPGVSSVEPETVTMSFTVQFERKVPNNIAAIDCFKRQVCESIRKDHGCYIAEVISEARIT